MRVSLNGAYSFVEASDASEALEAARSARPDLVLLDVMMPGASGLTVVESLRSDPALRETPVVVVSAFAQEADRVAAADAGADSFLAKPFDPDELVSIVEQLLAERG